MNYVVKLLCIGLLSLSFTASAQSELTKSAQTHNKEQATHNAQRESGFKLTEKEYLAQNKALEERKRKVQNQIDMLAKTFSKNEGELAKQEEKLRLDTGSLGELFGVVRQAAKELESENQTSVTGADSTQYSQAVTSIAAAKTLPTLLQLTDLWLSMDEQIQASAELKETEVKVIDGEGNIAPQLAYRIGSIGLISEQGYLHWDGKRQDATYYSKQPENGPRLNSLSELSEGNVETMIVDPSRGFMLDQLALTPSLFERLQAGGVVGQIILTLLVIGLIIAIFRGSKLALVQQQIKKQLKTPETPTDNPLGRILSVYDEEKHRNVESLELRLLEAIVDEQQGLEKGLSMLKLLAALAPMLGLLGTVTGMIETFQVITQFGNGDPKVMAGGISMALVTTVLGLVAAMPLLFAHNILSTQAENIRSILEKQGIGLVAIQAEKQQAKSTVGNEL
ncbi:MotA/TolQ/ExbB proton channel family protein [Aliivibrio fischeri]|uniref:MotA/TolQ/ExbB proton channel family protein n=1 Tax=Aliivibrio fischeri TaxID=668 RepID=UPI0007C44E97|nr:MotA/TolQ/ExbB proton channel family protein [Aliivibrio fischeri]MBP3139965.1 MotA/TolQ/ExbB proton channel family protein [Aliivibrio fischeri]MBP3154346.1 MotA/TolQ/ExbB proton channel family protein [Aliivibrio fischeri]MCE7572085.1 MotA/TolQ/ExbB proton channel family protein [Aliivibrio fischeri]